MWLKTYEGLRQADDPGPLGTDASEKRNDVRVVDMRAGWTIALREWGEQVGSARILAISLLVVVLTPLSIYVGARDYQARLLDFQWLEDKKQQLADGPAGRQVSGYDFHWTSENELMVLRVMRPPQPLSVLVRGLDGSLPKYWDFSSRGIEPGPPARTSNRLADTYQHLDFEFLVRAVFGLMAVLIGVDAVVGEKENGTLRAALSHPVSRRMFLFGKLAGGGATLLSALALAFPIALFSCWILDLDLFSRDSLQKLALIFAVWAAYLLCVYCMGLLISSLTTSRKTALLFAMVSWFVFVLAVAPLATLSARAFVPLPTPRSLQAERERIEGELRGKAGRELGRVYREVTGAPVGSISGVEYNRHKEEIDRLSHPIVADYLDDRRRALEDVQRDYQTGRVRQQRIARSIMMLSPASAVASIGSDLSGTGDAHFEAWLNALGDYFARLNGSLFEDPPFVQIDNGDAFFHLQRRPPPSLETLPRFNPPAVALATVFRSSLPAIAVLAAYIVIFLTAGFIAFSRYDVR